MKTYRAFAQIGGGKFLGRVQANSKEEAVEAASDLETAHVSICHHCSDQIEDAQILEVIVEEGR